MAMAATVRSTETLQLRWSFEVFVELGQTWQLLPHRHTAEDFSDNPSDRNLTGRAISKYRSDVR